MHAHTDPRAARLALLSTATAVDILKDHEAHRLVFRGVRAMRPTGRSIAGPARTLRFLPRRSDVAAPPNGRRFAGIFEDIRPGEVLVMDPSGCTEGAVIGDMLATRADRMGAIAVVTDGAVRDLAGMAGLGIALYATTIVPMAIFNFRIPWEIDVAVQCGGALVLPGDWILADDEAAIVVPQSLVDTLAEGAQSFLSEEEFCRRLLLQGLPLSRAYPLPPALRQRYAQFVENGAVPTNDEVNALMESSR